MYDLKHLGWIQDKYDRHDFIFKPKVVKLPPSVDLTKACPPVYDQGNLGSCTAQAIAAHVQFNRMKQNGPNFIPSRLFLYWNERFIEGTVNQDAGAEIRDGIKSVVKYGDCTEGLWPYLIEKFKVKPSSKCYKEALKYQVLEYRRLTSVADMKACLAEGYPFVFGITCYSNFPMDTTTGAIPMPKGVTEGGHAMLCVGYNSTKFIIRNSWGDGWGRKGYGSIPQKYLADPDLAADFWTIRTVE